MFYFIICLGLILSAMFGAVVLYAYIQPKIKQITIKNQEIEQYNQSLHDNCENIKQELNKLLDQKSDLNLELDFLTTEKEKAHTAYLLLQKEKHELQTDCVVLQKEKENAKTAIQDLKEQATESAKVFEEQCISQAQQNIEQQLEKLSDQYQKAEDEYKIEYQKVIEDCVADLKQQLTSKEIEIEKITNIFNDLLAKTNSAIEAAKRAEEIRAAADFYKLQLSETDLQEIEMLRNVAPYLRDKEPLNKVIWKCYYEKPTTDLIGRVIGSGVHTGIYKITNLQNQMCYVGQAVSLSDRWKQHIKRGLGAETPTKNKLYPAMMSFGPESFSFEVIEECDRSMLDSREDYWQDYFHAKDFGYSIK